MNPNRASIAKLLVLAVFLFAAPILHAQNDPPGDPVFTSGLKPYGSFQGGDIDTVNLENLALDLHIPLVNYPQRGGKLHLGFNVQYTNQVFQFVTTKVLGVPVSGYAPSAGGVSIRPDFVVNYYVPANVNSYSNVVTPDGSTHYVIGLTSNETYTDDGTGFQGTHDNAFLGCPYTQTITDRYGVRTTSGCTSLGNNVYPPFFFIEDPNGNTITENYNSTQTSVTWTDSMGKVLNEPSISDQGAVGAGGSTSTTDYSGCTGILPISSAYLWNLPGYDNRPETYKICYATVYINVPGICGSDSTCHSGMTPYSMMQSIVLPNLAAWTFTYDSANPNDNNSTGFGDLIQITFPTGGTINYTWTTYCPASQTSPVCYPDQSFSRAVATRTVNANDGTGNHTWTYTQTYPSTRGGDNHLYTAMYTTVQDQLGNQSVHTMSQLPSDDPYAIQNYDLYYETQAVQYQGSSTSGTVLKTTQTSYVPVVNENDGTETPPLPSTITTILPNGLQAKVQKSYEYPVVEGGTNYPVSDGNVLIESEYGYGTGAPGSLLRTTTTAYMDSVVSNYLSNNLLALPYTVQVTDGGGVQRAYSIFNYDQSSPTPSGVSVQHDSSPWAGTYRGNATSVSRWIGGSVISTANCPGSGSSGYLTSYNVFFDTGTVDMATDACGTSAGDPKHTTMFAYSSAYAGALPTTITNPLGQPTIMAYDFNSGLLTSSTDPNSQTTSYTYDEMWNPLTVNYPDGGNTTISYNGYALPLNVTTTQIATPDPSVVSSVTYDGLGRTSTAIAPNGAITNTTYDPDGRVASVSNPHFSSPYPSDGITSYGYDALNRKVSQMYSGDGSSLTWKYTGNVTDSYDEDGHHWQRATDALGRLTTVLEPDSSNNPTVETDYGYDANNNLTSVLQKGGSGATPLSRSFIYDGLSRLLTATNPESGSTMYTYDADSNPITRQDARGMVTTYSYDALNRILGKSYSDSTYPATYSYDTSSAPGARNTIGRLTDEKTAVQTVVMTERAVDQYDARGRVLSERQCFQGGCAAAAYTLTRSYDLAGATVLANNGVSNGQPATFGYGYDAGQRLQSVTGSLSDATHPAVLFQAQQYGPIGLLQAGYAAPTVGGTAAFSQTLSYDSRTRLTGETYSTAGPATLYSYTVGYDPAGNVTGMNDSAMGTWSYAVDPMNRLSGGTANSGVYAGLTLGWGYDYFGNRKSQTAGGSYGGPLPRPAPVSFTARNNNQVDQWAYDAAGDVVNDGTNLYEYDAEGRQTGTL